MNKSERPQKPASSRSRTPAWLWSIPLPPAASGQLETALRERIKELNCLYGISKLAEKNRASLESFLGELVDFLPHSWQYADQTCARITFRGSVYYSTGFIESAWHQSAAIYLGKELAGECRVYYRSEFPSADEGPFLKEERALLDAVAEQVGKVAAGFFAELELQEMNRQLKLERQALQETNIALKVVLGRNENEKQEIHRDVRHNVDKILMPIIDSLAFHLPASKKKYIELLKTNLTEITRPFLGGLSADFHALSPMEMIISNMIKNGMTSKQIADMRGVSVATINHHREKIRRKLGIANQAVNLATFLQHNSIES